MSLEVAAYYLTTALKARASSWVPCDVSPGELEREYGGPRAQLAGRVMADWLWSESVIRALAAVGVYLSYDRQQQIFELRPLTRASRSNPTTREPIESK